MIRFIVCLCLTILTWPILFLLTLSVILFFLWMASSSGSGGPSSNPFMSPKSLYLWYKQKWLDMVTGLNKFLDEECK
jgi:hypothetical protein